MPQHKLINELLLGLCQEEFQDIMVSGLNLDSRQVQPGEIFIACPSFFSKEDGRAYMEQAEKAGAVAILYEAQNAETFLAIKALRSIPCIPIDNLRDKISEIAGRFYGHPSRKLKLVGVTGTNGKTSITFFLAEVAKMLGMKAAVIGTLGYGLPQHLKETGYTTPNPIEMQKILAELVEEGVEYVAMEVSSHALDQGRVAALQFDQAIFTNLTRDHLDYHKTMESYGAAKALLFNFPGLKHCIINSDDEFGWNLLQNLYAKQTPCVAFSANGYHRDIPVPYVRAQHVNLHTAGLTAGIVSSWGGGVLQSKLLGRFYLSNLLAVFSAFAAEGFQPETLLPILIELTPIPGRMETYRSGSKKPIVMVDYAHTPDALKQVLLALKEHEFGAIWCVFGCGGDRDPGKRPEMGAIAEEYADYVILTDDNPRFEDPAKIITEIKAGMTQPQRVVVEHDRYRAILHALQSAGSKDLVLIAGKGHEHYQQIGNEKKPFSDGLTVQMILTELT